jgi:fatty acid desaturase
MNDTRMRGDGRTRGNRFADDSSKELVQQFLAEGKNFVREEAALIRLEVEEIADEARQRLRSDLASAKAELRTEGKKVARAGGVLAGGGVLAQAALYLGLFAVVFALATVMPLWGATLLVAVVVGVVGAFLIYGGIHQMKRVTLRKTVHHLEEDKQWMRRKGHALKSAIRAGV